jgi:lipopolysaccharide transport system ATP-binding protein
VSILSVQNLGKSYRQYHSELDRILGWFGIKVKPASEHWILQGVSFDVQKGESIGIVGKNGAGKSTLLKMITGTLQPTDGSVCVYGKISAILELGMGFNGDLTARQNVLHALGLQGYAYQEIMDQMPTIQDFAEIGDYFDEPLRTYSSGMQMRVAFAVATAFRPDILIVDEALSVGDAYFQHKSFDKIKQFKEQGTSLLLVSHDANSIKMVCDRVVLLQNGGVLMEGKPEVVMDFYNASLADHQEQKIRQVDLGEGKNQTISGTGESRILKVELFNEKGELADHLAVGEKVKLVVHTKMFEDIDQLVLGYAIKNHLGQVLYGTNTWHTKQVLENLKQNQEIIFTIDFEANFGPGSYSLQLALVNSDTHLDKNYEWRDLAYVFKVINVEKDFFVGMSFVHSSIGIKI